MYIPFEDLPGESRIWIYQSNRKFSEEEFSEIETDLKAFVEEWAAHGTSLEASFLLKYNRFIILAVNQDVQAATGCSIDSSVRFIKQIEKTLFPSRKQWGIWTTVYIKWLKNALTQVQENYADYGILGRLQV